MYAPVREDSTFVRLMDRAVTAKVMRRGSAFAGAGGLRNMYCREEKSPRRNGGDTMMSNLGRCPLIMMRAVRYKGIGERWHVLQGGGGTGFTGSCCNQTAARTYTVKPLHVFIVFEGLMRRYVV